MTRTTSPIPRLQVFKDLDSGEVFVAEWYPTISHGWQLRIADEGFQSEDHARDWIRETLYD